MNILDIITTCNDPGLANILTIIKKILNLIQLLGPLLAIISLVVIFINMVNKPDEKKNFSKIKNSIIALVLTFFIPLIVDTAMFLVDENSTLSACWNNSTEKSTCISGIFYRTNGSAGAFVKLARVLGIDWVLLGDGDMQGRKTINEIADCGYSREEIAQI